MGRQRWRAAVVAAVLAVAAAPAAGETIDEGQLAALPDDAARDAVRALWRAVDADDAKAMQALIGPGGLRAHGRRVARKELARRLASEGVAGVLGLDPDGIPQVRLVARKIQLFTGAGETRAAVLGKHGKRWTLDGIRLVADAPRPLALVLLIDRSGSMTGAKMELAKEAVRAALETLDATDLVAVIGFDTVATVVVPLERAANRSRINERVGRLAPGGGTNLLPALNEALALLSPRTGLHRHVVLLTDGEAPYEGIVEVVDELRAGGATVSTVGLPDADRGLLSLIADHGGGRMYFTDAAEPLPRIFAKEVTEARN